MVLFSDGFVLSGELSACLGLAEDGFLTRAGPLGAKLFGSNFGKATPFEGLLGGDVCTSTATLAVKFLLDDRTSSSYNKEIID